VPKFSLIINIAAVSILFFQLAAALTNLAVHSRFYPKLFIPPTNRLVLVTGCDSGFGLALAKRLDFYGFHVLAGVLSKESEGCKHLDTHGSKRLKTVKLNVTKQEEIDEVVDLVAYLTNYKPILDELNQKQSSLPIFDRKFKNPIFGNADGDLKLWAVVNNAGIAQFTPFEFGKIEDDLIPMFDVNVFGIIRCTRAFLPFLRQSEGRIVNVGSIADRLTIGGLTGYSMAKHAVRSMTDGLRQELHKFKIKSILVEPTLYKTPIANIETLVNKFNECYDRTDKKVLAEYGNQEFKDRFTTHLRKMTVLTRKNTNEVVDCLEDACINSNPKEQYWAANFLQKILFWLANQADVTVIDRICTFRTPKKVVDSLQAINELL